MQSLLASQQRCFSAKHAFKPAKAPRTGVAVRAAVAEKMRSKQAAYRFPFCKIAGQEDMKLALLLNLVDPSIGGVLILGDRGTAKSVAVRATVDLLPEIEVVEGDSFNSDPKDPQNMGPDALARYKKGEKLPTKLARTPLVELPLGATEDRICGTIDVEKALTQGVKAYEPGLLAKANRGILYVDEVNLLDDGLVDVVLDSAASGINTVEREGISIVHPAKFIMIGSGNPAEGELRPQLLDRFGLSVQVSTLMDTAQRTQMCLDRLAFDTDPAAFLASCEPQQQALRDKLAAARQKLRSVRFSEQFKLLVSDVCSRLNVDGLRGDIVSFRAARALVALEGRGEVTKDDLERVLPLSLNHRLRKDVLDVIDTGTKVKLMFKRVSDPEFQRKEEAAKKAAEEKAKADAQSNKKAGAWAGLPPRK